MLFSGIDKSGGDGSQQYDNGTNKLTDIDDTQAADSEANRTGKYPYREQEDAQKPL